MKQSQFARALWYGILGALFFAFTFIFNRSMNLSGGSWMWSASLRYLFSLPMLAVLAWRKGELAGVLSAIKKRALDLVGLEYGWFWAFLWATVSSVHLWRVLVCGGYLADYDSSWSALDPSLWAEGTW